MNELSLLKRLYDVESLRRDIYFFFKPKSKLKEILKSHWNEMIELEKLEQNFEQLFYIFDKKGIRIAVIPSQKNDFWSYRIYTSCEIQIANHFYSRNEASIAAVNKAVIMFNQNNNTNNGESGTKS